MTIHRLLLSGVLSLLLATGSTAYATTTVSGALSANTTWTAAASPYYVSAHVTVPNGVTLTIEPGTVVKFAQSQSLFINGTLSATGSSGQKITFTDYRDDSAGGDTNGDGTASAPVPGWWQGIEVNTGGTATLANCEIRYGGGYGATANLYKTGTGTLSVAASTISNSANFGIYLNAATSATTVSGTTINNNLQYGLYAIGDSPATITGNTIASNGKYGIYANVTNPATFSVNSNSFSGNAIAPIGVTAASSGVALGTGNSYTGARYTLVEGGTITSNQTWGAVGTDILYYLTGHVTVANGSTLTVRPQTVVKFAQGQGLFVNGTLNAVATAGKEIFFTDFRDDTAGGDSNGDGSAINPVPGWWRGIEVYNFGSATIDYCVIRYGGEPYANLYKTGNGTITINHSTFSNSSSHGIYLNDASGTVAISGNALNNNVLYGIYALGNSPAATSGNSIGSNGRFGVYANVTTPVSFSVSGTSFSDNGVAPIGVTAASSGIAIAGDNSFTGRSYVYIEGGTIASSQSWGTAGAALVYYVSDHVTTAANQTLTVRPGTVVKFAPGVALFFSGNLSAVGTADNKIYFTDIRDDTIGGDSNGDGSATTPTSGRWRGIELNNYAGATIDYCVIRYGSSAAGQQANLYKGGDGNVSVSNSVISNGAYRGISLVNTTGTVAITTSTITGNAAYDIYLSGSGATPSITKNQISGSNIGVYCDAGANPVIGGSTANANDIFNNIAYSVQSTSASPTVNATYNWWGFVDGPKLSGNNKVSSFVDTANFLAASVFGNTSLGNAPQKTTINSMTISSDTTWTLANSPYYITGDISVATGKTLTIEPGVVVKFAQNVWLWIAGTLNAVGTSSNRITFTDYRDDTAGGDTNGDGAATIPSPGWWRGIVVADGASAALNYCTVRYAGSSDPSYANVYKTGANGTLTITNSTISHSYVYGVNLTGAGGTTTISGSTFSSNGVGYNGYYYDGIYAVGTSAPTISSSTFSGNGRYGVYATVAMPSSFSVGSSTFVYNGTAPIGVSAASSGIAVADDNTFTGANYIYVEDGTIASSQTWGNGHRYYYLAGNVTVAPGPTLTVRPGTIVKFTQNVGIHVGGILDATGTSGAKIYFTDIRDDSIGGDTNNDGTATIPRPGWWRGILVNDGGSATLANCVIRYGGSSAPNSSNVYKTGANGTLTVTDSTISHSLAYGLNLNGAAGMTTISGSTFNANGVGYNGYYYDGIYASGTSPATLSGTSFNANGRFGIYASVNTPSTFTVGSSSFAYNGTAPIGVSAASSGIAVAASNTYTGINYIYIEDGTISSNQSWGNDTAATYFLAGNVTVAAGPTLTIKKGTVVKFTQNVGIWVSGALSAVGTSDSKIFFTDVRDDASGGDSNGDGSATIPRPGWWRGILVNDVGTATLANCVVRYGGSSGPNSSNVYKTGAGSFSLTNSIISSSSYYGLYLNGASSGSTISGNTFSSNGYDGILASGTSPATISGNTFTANSRYGIYANAPAPTVFTISNNTFTANSSAPIEMSAVGSGAIVSDDNNFVGPLYVEGGDIGTSITWGNNRIYYVTGTITVPTGATLTVTPGRTIKFAQNVGIWVSGFLSAVGTTDNRITFTDYRDDTIGGDTNGDSTASSPEAAWWYGLHFNDGGSGTIDYATIRYARSGDYGYPYYVAVAGVYKTGPGNVSVTNSTIEKTNNSGIRIINSTGAHTLSNNIVRDNPSHGILLQTAGTVLVNSNNVTNSGVGSTGVHGLYVENTLATLTNNTVSGSGGYGLFVTGTSLPTSITLNTLNNNSVGPVGMSADSSGTVIAADNTFTGPIHVEGGSLTRDTSWVNNRVYYVKGSITVNGSKILTVPAGRIVKFAQDTGLFIDGTLSAVGTGTNRITFTDYRDDTIGGDTNGDSTATSPAAAWWYGLHFNDGGTGTVDYATIRYNKSGGYGWPYYNNFAGVYKTGTGNVSVTNSTFEQANNYGIWFLNSTGVHTISSNAVRDNGSHGILLQTAGTVTVTGNSVTGNGVGNTGVHGLYMENTPVTLTSNTVSGSGGYGLFVTGATLPTSVTLNTLNGNGVGPVGMSADSSGTVIAADNTFTGPIHVENGNLTRDTSWVNDRIYYVKGSITVNGSKTLTVPAGRIVKFAQDTGLFMDGTLKAIGTSNNRITFTDYRDDSIGGDSNNDSTATSPAPAWWYGLHFNDGGSGTVDYATIRYNKSGGYGWPYYNNFAGVYKTGSGNVSVTNSTFEQANNYGIWLLNSTGVHTISSNAVRDNGSHGILLQTAGTVTVTGNSVTGNGVGNTGVHGLYMENTPATLTSNTVSSSGGYGLFVTGATLPASITLNTLNGNSVGPVGMSADSSGTIIAADNTFTGPIHVEGGSLTRATAWANDRVYYVKGSITVNSGKTLTVPAGRTVKFSGDTGLFVDGTLSATGASGNRITFTDYRDDTIGGDTNGDTNTTLPTPGWWYGINIHNGGSATIDYTTVRYTKGGGYGWPYYDNYASIYKTGSGALVVSHALIEQSSGYGLWILNSTVTQTVSSTTSRNNGNYGAVIEGSGTGVTLSGNTFESNAHSGIYIGNSSPLIQGNTIRYNTNYGIYADGASTAANIFKNTIFANAVGVYCANSANPLIGGSAVNGNNIFGNTSYGVQNTSTGEVDASYNWWGDATGPSHPTLNPSGTGNAVSDSVYFDGFLATTPVPIAVEQVTPTSHYFGHVSIGTTSTAQVFTITNKGTQNLTFSALTLTGANPAEFQISQNLCNGQSLATNSSCTISVVYAPTKGGPAQARLTIESNDIYTPTFNVPLTGAGSVLLPFRDDFNNGSKSTAWAIINEDPANYSLTDNPDFLRIKTSSTDFAGASNNVKNLFVLPIPTGLTHFVATTKMLFPTRPTQNYQQGGIVLLAEKNGAPDLDNYLRAQYVYYSPGRRFETSYDVNASPTSFQGPVVTGIGTATPVWLRIIRNGTNYRAEWSLDGQTYTLINTFTGSWDISYVALHAINGDQSPAASIPVDYDYFEVKPVPVYGISPATGDFGQVTVGGPSTTKTYTLSNSGSGDLIISSIATTGNDNTSFIIGQGSCGTLPATVTPGSTCGFTMSFTPTSGGAKTAPLVITSNDPGSPQTITLTGTGLYSLALHFTGTGWGSLVDATNGIACTTDCSVALASGTAISLSETPQYSIFQGWTGACTGTGACSFSMDTGKSVTATFIKDTAHMVRIDWVGEGANYFSSLQEAYGFAQPADVIMAWGLTFSELLNLNQNLPVTLKGGYNSGYTSNTGLSTLLGTLTITKGSMTVENLVIQ